MSDAIYAIWNALSSLGTNKAKQMILPCESTWIKLRYKYADGTDIPGAGYVIKNRITGGTLASGNLDAHGYVFEVLPIGTVCDYYFYDDPPYQIDAAYLCAAQTLNPLKGSDLTDAISADAFQNVKSLWGDPSFTGKADFELSPTLGKLASSAVASQTPHVPHPKVEEEFSLLLPALLVQEAEDLWEAAAFNRLACVSDQGRVISAILYAIHKRPDIALGDLVDMLNTAGKGNAVRWLRDLGGKTDGHIDTVISQIGKILDLTQSDCDRISGAGKKKKVSTEIRALSRVISERIGLLKPKVANAIRGILSVPSAKLKIITAGDFREIHAGTLEVMNLFQQSAIPLVEWVMPPLPPIHWIALQYNHKDGSGVPGAKYAVEGDKGNWKGDLNDAGFAFIPLVPEGTVFTFSFDSDPAYVLDENFKSKKNPTNELPKDFLTRAIAAKKFKNNDLKWEDTPCTSDPDFQSKPTLGKIIHNLLIRHSPVVAGKDEERPLAKVLYAHIMKPDDKLWLPCALHRLSACLGDEGLLIQSVLCQIHAAPDTKREQLVKLLNTAGKGNAVAWLKKLQGNMDQHADAASQNLNGVLSDLKTELQRIQNGESVNVGDGARAFAGVLVERVDQLSGQVDGKVKAEWKALSDRLKDITGQSQQVKHPGVLDQINVHIQTAEALPQWQAPPVEIPVWTALLYLHADELPVGQTKWVIEFDDGSGSKSGDLTNLGFAFVPDMPPGKTFKYYFHTDPNPDLTLKDSAKSAARTSKPIDGDFVQNAIDGDKFKTVKLKWGKSEITDELTFQNEPTVAGIARNLVIRNTEFTTRPTDEEELTGLLYPLLLRQADNSVYWSAAVFSRLGCVWKEQGALVQGILLKLKQSPDTGLEDLVKLVNSAAKGNAVKWLRKLDGNMPDCVEKVSASLTKIMSDLQAELVKLKDGAPIKISAPARSYAQMVWDRIEVVRPKVQDEVKKILDPVTANLKKAVEEHLVPKQAGSLETANIQKQVAVAPPVWQPDPAELLPWAELFYFHADGTGVGGASYKIENLGNNLVRQGTLDPNGFAFEPDLPDAAFQFYFHDDPLQYKPADGHKTAARQPAPLGADFVDKALAADRLKAAPGFFSWNDNAITNQPDFEAAPTIGKIAHQAVLLKTEHVAQAGDEAAMANLIGPLIKKTNSAQALWTGAVFNRLGALELPDARVIQELLHYLSTNGGATAADLVKRLNGAGKGNAVRWLKKLRDDMPSHRDAVAKNLKDIFAEVKSQCDKIATADKLKCSPGIQGYAKALSDAAGALDIDKQVKDLLDPLTNTLKDKLTAFKIVKEYGVLSGSNEIHQQAVAPDPYAAPAGILKPWIYIQYLHSDLTPVTAKYVLVDNGGTKLEGDLAAGAKFIDELDGGKTYEFYFRKEPAFAVDAPKKSVATALVALAPNLLTTNANKWAWYTLARYPYGWGDTGIASLADFEADPNIGKIVRDIVRANSPYLTKAGDFKDELDMTAMVRHLVMDNAETNVRVWSIVAMNRIGTMAHADGLLRRSVLLRLLFEDPVTPTTLKDLVAFLNSVGKGHAVEWLEQLANDMPAHRDAVILSAETILGAVNTELNKIDRPGVNGHVRGIVAARKVQANTAKAAANAQIKLVLDPLTAKLKSLLPPTVPQLRFKTNGALNQANIFVQPVKPFPECVPECYLPPAWSLDPNIEVIYLYPDGTGIQNAKYRIDTGAGGRLHDGDTSAAGSSTVKQIPAGTTSVKYWFEDDPLAYTVKAEVKPWPNPYRSLPVGYASTAAATGVLSGDSLPDGSLTVRNQAAFNGAPSLAAIISDAIIRNSTNVSAAADVTDLGAVIQNFLADPPVRNPDLWFRAGVNRIGTIADEGSILRGLLLFLRYKAPVSGDTLLALMNWAGKGNAARWLKARNMPTQINAAVTSMQAILDEVRDRVEDLRAHNQVSFKIKLQMAALKIRIKSARDEADAQIKAALGKDLPAFNALLVSGALYQKFLTTPLTRNTYQQRVEQFLECNDTIDEACKEAVDIAAAAAVVAANAPLVHALGNPAPGPPYSDLFKPANMDDHGWRALSQFGAGTRGAKAKELAPVLARATKANFGSTIEGETGVTLQSVRLMGAAPQTSVNGDWTVTMGSWSGGEMWSFQHSDGTLIRYKPDGDDFMKPPAATYSVELLKDTAQGYVPNAVNPLANAAFKIDSQGNAVPKGPADATPLAVPVACGGTNAAEVNKHYKDHLMKSGHRPLRF